MAAARMENKRNELEMLLKQSNKLWLHLYSECVLRPSGGCLNGKKKNGLLLVSVKPKSEVTPLNPLELQVIAVQKHPDLVLSYSFSS